MKAIYAERYGIINKRVRIVKMFGRNLKKEQLLKRVGSIGQIGGIKKYTLTEGRACGTSVIEIRLGDGFMFTVIPDRGMDIAWMEYCGKPIGYISNVGIVSPFLFEADEYGWNRSFFGGILTTCGLTQIGLPCVDNGEKLGLHGRVSNIPAEEVCAESYWKQDDFLMKVRGKVKQACAFGENLMLEREITGKLGEKVITICDKVVNNGFQSTPFQILYHFNFGFPIIDEYSRLISNIKTTYPINQEAESEISKYMFFQEPENNYKSRIYAHNMAADKNGHTLVGIINDSQQLGVYLKYNTKELPHLIEFKSMDEQYYLVALEPCNSIENREIARRKNTLKYISPGETKEINLELGIISGQQEINAFAKAVGSLLY